MFAWQATVQDEFGNAVLLPVVTVYLEDGLTLASIYDEAGDPLPNPLTGTLEGFVQFWAESGAYKIIGADGPAETSEWSVFLDTPLQDAVDAAEAAAVAAETALDAINARELFVDAYGAVHNGISDDAPSINAALSAAATYGARYVTFGPHVNYLIKSPLVLPDGVVLRGQGPTKTAIVCAVDMPLLSSVIQGHNYIGGQIEHDDYSQDWHVQDMTIDCNGWNRRAAQGMSTGTNVGTAIQWSTVKNCTADNVVIIAPFSHGIDASASIYLEDATRQPLGPSLDCVATNVTVFNPVFDDAFTVHNSGRIFYDRCQAFYDWATYEGVYSNNWRYGLEFDEGSWDCHATDCRVEGFYRGFVWKNHAASRGSNYCSFTRCWAKDTINAFYFYQGTSGGGVHTGHDVVMRGCTIEAPRSTATNPLWVSETVKAQLITTWDVVGLLVDGLILIDVAGGRSIFTGPKTTGVTVKDVRIYGDLTATGDSTATEGLFRINGGLSAVATVTIEGINHLRGTAAHPYVYINDGEGFYKISGVFARNTIGIEAVRVTSLVANGVEVTGVMQVGVGDSIYEERSALTLHPTFQQRFFQIRDITIPSGSPEGSANAVQGTHCRGTASGNLFKLNSVDGNTGWVAIT